MIVKEIHPMMRLFQMVEIAKMDEIPSLINTIALNKKALEQL